MNDPSSREATTSAEVLRPAMLVGAAILVYFAVATLVGRFPVTDEVFFKAAGRQWAAGRGFGAPELEGALGNVSPPVTEVFFLHPPMYPFLFGLWTRLLGFGARQCIAFDASIHAVLTGLTFALAWRVFSSLGHARRWLAIGAAVAILPLGTAGRPDELAMCFGSLAWLLLLVTNPRAPLLVSAGIALGFCAGTSTGAAAATGFVALTLLLRAPDNQRFSVGRSLRICLLFTAGTIVGISAALGPLLATHANALNQYLTHARFLVGRVTILNAWADARPHALKYYGFLFGTVTSGLIAAMLIGTPKAWRVWANYGLGAWAYLLFLGAFLGLRYTYTWFIGPWILLSALHLIFLLANAPGKRMRSVLPAGVLAAGYLTFTAYFVKEIIVVGTLPASQRLEASSARLRAVIPPGATVLTKDLWWFVAERNRTYEPMFSHPPEDRIDYVALSANGSGVPGRVVPLDPNVWSHSFTSRMVEVANDLPQHPTKVLGLRLTNSAYGFGSVVYRVAPPGH